MKNEIEEIKIPLFDRILEFVSLCLVGISIFFLGKYYSKLPELIPTRFNFDGTAKEMMQKDSLLIKPLIGILLFVLFFAISRSNKNFTGVSQNTQRPITFYLNTARMMRWMGVIIQLGISCSIIGVIAFYVFKMQLFSMWLPIIFLVLIFLNFFYYYLYQNNKLN
jgi:uncharacterized membrane protein